MSLYLVTGCAGFIASRVTEFLLDARHTVVGIDNLNAAYDTRLKHWRLGRLRGREGFEFQEFDIADRAKLTSIWRPFDAVINLAARAGVRQSVENPWVYVETNVTGTLNLLECCRSTAIPKFVLASTSSLYGAHNPRPFSETANTDLPLSPYAASKKAAEALCASYRHLYGIDITVLRYFTVYGPAGRPDMSLFRFVQWIAEERPVIVYGDGKQERDFTYVDDIAQGTIAALKPLGHEVINLGSDKPIVLLDTIHLIEDLLDKKAQIAFHPPAPADVRATWANIEKAANLLDWRPRFSFPAGVKNLVDWYLANRSWAREIVTGE